MTDKEWFSLKIREYEKAMYIFAKSILKNDPDVSEVLSESILKAYVNLENLKNKNAFKSWILSIVHNESVKFINRNKKYVDMEDIYESSFEESVDIETKLSLKDAISKLKPGYREVIILFYYEDMSVFEIAKILESNDITIRKRLQRARETLKEILKEDFINE